MLHNQIKPCLWFDRQAEEAAHFYTGIFPDSGIKNASRYGKKWVGQHGMQEDLLLTAEVTLYGFNFLFLNGGPAFKPNPSVSFFVVCKSPEEVDHLYEKLNQQALVMMPLDQYEWSKRYVWLQDKFGVSWQLFYGEFDYPGQKIVPALMFTGDNAGKAADAISFYCSVFKNASVKTLQKYTRGEDKEGMLKHAQFKLNDTAFAAMDSSYPHKFSFNEGVSFVVECKDQQEIDYFWTRLTEGGTESMCGWLKDKYGLSWQIVPEVLAHLMSDPLKSERVMQAFMQMKKFEIEKLVNA